MFHFGLPSEPLEFHNNEDTKIPKFNHLLYIGAGTDPIPLPVAINAVYVDKAYYPKSVDMLINKAKTFYSTLEEPKTEWNQFENRHVAKVTFKWAKMPNLTKAGDVTQLIYLFNTEDLDLGQDAFKEMTEKTDLMWTCGFEPKKECLKNMDLNQVILAAGNYDGYSQLKRNHTVPEIFNCIGKFHSIQYLSDAFRVRRRDWKNSTLKSLFPKDLKYSDLQKLLAYQLSKETMNLKEWQNQNELYFLNDPYVYFEHLKQNEYAPLHEAAYYGKIKKVGDLLNNGKYDVNEKDLNESTPLHDAVSQGHRKLVQFLLNRGADPNAVDYGDITPLHIAAECGHLNITKILIKHGAKVNAETRISKFTPLHKAVQQNWEDIIEILIQNGARTDVEDLLLGKTLSELMDNAFKNDLEKAYGNSCKCCD